MYNIMIVDDIKKVVHGLVYDIDWQQIQVKEVFKAYSAKQALEHMEQNRIDVVITDIRMPGKNGLVMIQEMKDKWNHCKFIIFSGYDEFLYAQKAIQLDVFRFLAKPISYDELIDVVRLAIEDLEAKLHQSLAFNLAEEKIRNMIPVLGQNLLFQLIVRGNDEWIYKSDQWHNYGVKLKYGLPYQIVLIRVDEWMNTNDMYSRATNEIALKYFAMDILFSDFNVVEAFVDQDGNIILIGQKEKLSLMHEALNTIKSLFELLQKIVLDSIQCEISLFYGEPADSIDQLRIGYFKMKEMASNKIFYPSGLIVGIESIPTFKDTIKHTNEPLYQLPFSLMPGLTIENVEQQLKQWFEGLNDRISLVDDHILSIYNLVSFSLIQDSLSKGISIHQWSGEDILFFRGISHYPTIKQLQVDIMRVIKKYIDYMEQQQTKQTNVWVQKAKNYINAHYTKEISVTDIAKEIYLHPNYLSRLFKKNTGQSISEYIIYLRIEKAKVCLQIIDKKVYEVAYEVGYESVPHFQSLFKRIVGMSPKEYQMKQIQ